MEAVITGASSGIGKAVAFQLAELGFHLHILGRNTSTLNDVATEIKNKFKHINVNVITVDLSDEIAVGFAVEAINQKANKINVLVHAAAEYKTGSLILDDGHMLKNQFNTQVVGFHQLLIGVLGGLKKYNNSNIFVIGSVVSQNPRVTAAQYSIAKAAQESYCKIVAEQVRDYGIKLTLISPGSVNTPSWKGEDAERDKFIQPEDIALIIKNALMLSSEAWIEKVTIRPRHKNI